MGSGPLVGSGWAACLAVAGCWLLGALRCAAGGFKFALTVIAVRGVLQLVVLYVLTYVRYGLRQFRSLVPYSVVQCSAVFKTDA